MALAALLVACALNVRAPEQAQASFADYHPGTWMSYADTSWYTKNPSASSYTISSAAQLGGLALLVNERSGVQFAGKTITLSKNIDLSAHDWFPIGAGEPLAMQRFGGTFDGSGHTISGMHTPEGSLSMGLFRCTEGGLIEDLTVSGEVVGTNNLAGVVVDADGTSFYRVTNRVNVTSTSSTHSCVGGIVAAFLTVEDATNPNQSKSVTMQECVNYGTIHAVSSSGCVGGVLGSIMQDGGVYNIIRCQNLGKIIVDGGAADSATSRNGVGGIVGSTVFNGTYKIQQCSNSGSIKSSSTSSSAGGLVGYLSGGSESDVMYSYNTGKVSGAGKAAAGVVGWNESSGATVAFTYNAGAVSGTNAAAILSNDAGGAKFKSNLFVEGTAAGAFGDGSSAKGKAESRTLAQMKTQATLVTLNNGGKKDYFSIEEDKNDGLPILGGTKHPGKNGETEEGDGGLDEAVAGISAGDSGTGDGDGTGEGADDGGSPATAAPDGDADTLAGGDEGGSGDSGTEASVDAVEAEVVESAASQFEPLKLADVEVSQDALVSPDITPTAALLFGLAFAGLAVWGFVWRYLDFYTQRGRRKALARKAA